MNGVEAEEARTVGQRLWRLRDDRGKSLRVVAELAGMSTATLWRIEQGKRRLHVLVYYATELADAAARSTPSGWDSARRTSDRGRCARYWRRGTTSG